MFFRPKLKPHGFETQLPNQYQYVFIFAKTLGLNPSKLQQKVAFWKK